MDRLERELRNQMAALGPEARVLITLHRDVLTDLIALFDKHATSQDHRLRIAGILIAAGILVTRREGGSSQYVAQMIASHSVGPASSLEEHRDEIDELVGEIMPAAVTS